MKLFGFFKLGSPSASHSPSPSSKKSNNNDRKKVIGLPFFNSSKEIKESSSKREKHALNFESRKELEQTFMVFDKNGDGHISVAELKAWMYSFFFTILSKPKKPSEKELAFMVAQLDKDGDGFLSLPDFRHFLFSSSSCRIDEDEEEGTWFHAVDLNNDGLISIEELHQVMVQNLGIKSCTLQECRLIIEAHDEDGDGLLNAHEFRKLFVG